ncbi:MAG: DUF1127 domain-containing protein [Rhizobiaceae bacterium]|nr:DUF1127 domain-containing protein [Rhizobiaceae bacterium]
MKSATQNTIHYFPTRARLNPKDSAVAFIIRMAKVVRQWSDRASQRRRLSCMTPRELNDIGITAEQAWNEAAKPFWQTCWR